MAAPAKTYIVLPAVVNGAVTVAPVTNHAAVKTLAVKSAVGSGNQMVIYEAIEYVEPDVPTDVVDQLVLPIPDL